MFLANPTVSTSSRIERLGSRWLWRPRFGASQGQSWGQCLASISCSPTLIWADNYDGIGVHLAQRDVTMVTISRAPLPTLEAFTHRMGWTFTCCRRWDPTSTTTSM